MRKIDTSVFIGIDIGTTLIKCSAVDLYGRTVASHRHCNQLDYSKAGRAECNMVQLWENVAETIACVMHQLTSKHKVEAVSVAGNMVGLWILNKEMEPLQPAILWNDSRALPVLKSWIKNGVADRVFDLSLNVMNPGFTIPLLRWMQQNEQKKLNQAKHIFFCKDFIRYELTGEVSTEETDACHIPGDIHTRKYSEEIFEICGVGEYMHLFPEIHQSTEIAGVITKQAAERTGLPTGTPVVMGMGDVSASIVGLGCVSHNDLSLIIGTSCLCNATQNMPLFPPRSAGLSFLLPESNIARSLPNQTGTIALDWYIKEFFNMKSSPSKCEWDDLMIEMQKQVPDGSNGLIFHAYLNHTGVLAPVYEPSARGRLWGLHVQHNKYSILKSLFEGLSYAIEDCFSSLEGVDVHTVRIAGGASGNEYFTQLIADVLGASLEKVENQDVGAIGSAMAAGVGIGLWRSLEEASHSLCRVKSIIEPDQKRHEFFVPIVKQYKKLRSHLSEEYLEESKWEN